MTTTMTGTMGPGVRGNPGPMRHPSAPLGTSPTVRRGDPRRTAPSVNARLARTRTRPGRPRSPTAAIPAMRGGLTAAARTPTVTVSTLAREGLPGPIRHPAQLATRQGVHTAPGMRRRPPTAVQAITGRRTRDMPRRDMAADRRIPRRRDPESVTAPGTRHRGGALHTRDIAGLTGRCITLDAMLRGRTNAIRRPLTEGMPPGRNPMPGQCQRPGDRPSATKEQAGHRQSREQARREHGALTHSDQRTRKPSPDRSTPCGVPRKRRAGGRTARRDLRPSR